MRIASSTTCTALISAVVLAGCGATGGTAARTASNPSGTASVPSTATTTPDATRQSSATSTSSTSGQVEPSASAASALVFEVGGKKLDITPTDIYGAGKPGTIRHIIGKTN